MAEEHIPSPENPNNLVGEITTLTSEWAARIDFDALSQLGYFSGRTRLQELLEVINLRIDIDTGQILSMNPTLLEESLNRMKKNYALWESQQTPLLRDKTPQKPENENLSTILDKSLKLFPTIADAADISKVFNTYKNGWPDEIFTMVLVLQNFREMVRLGLLQETADPSLNKLMRMYLSLQEKYFQERFNGKNITPETDNPADTINITGLDENNPNTVVHEEDIRQLLKQFPPALLNGFSSIRITKEPSQVVRQMFPNMTGIQAVYLDPPYSGEKGAAIEMYLPISAPNTSDALHVRSTLDFFLLRLAHEFGHHIHTLASYEELKRWDEGRKANRLPLGLTTNSFYAQGTGDESYAAREEFADSNSYFVKGISVLQSQPDSQFRYNFFKRLFASRLQKR